MKKLIILSLILLLNWVKSLAQVYNFRIPLTNMSVISNGNKFEDILSKSYSHDPSIERLRYYYDSRLFQINLDSMVFKTDGEISSRITEIIQKDSECLLIRFQYVKSIGSGIVALKKVDVNRIEYCAFLIDTDMDFIEIFHGEVKELETAKIN